MKRNEICKFKYRKETPVKSGFTELDKITSDWKNGELIVIAARPSMGKSAFALSMIKNIAVDINTPVALFSLEMSMNQLACRFMINVSGVKNVDSSNEEELSLLNEAEKQLDNAPIFIDDTPSLSVHELRTKAFRLVREHQIKIIILDYLQLMNASGMTFGNREEELSVITRSLKALALELNIPIIAFSQLNRVVESCEGFEGKRPQLNDLRKLGSIEQDADMVCFIHRPDYYRIFEDGEGNDLHGMAEIIVAKNRNGQIGYALLKFSPEIHRFQNIDK